MKRIEFTTDYSIYVTKGGGGRCWQQGFYPHYAWLKFQEERHNHPNYGSHKINGIIQGDIKDLEKAKDSITIYQAGPNGIYQEHIRHFPLRIRYSRHLG